MKIDWTKVKEGFTIMDVLKEENKRLNNIINELEKYIISQMQEQETLKETKAPTYIFCKLQELKGSNGAIPPEVIGTNGEDGGLFDYGDR